MLGVLILGLALAQAPSGGAPPAPNGERLYMENCVECHGPEGDVVPDVDLGHGRFRRATTDPELVGIVLRGIPNTAMPPNSFTEAQAAASSLHSHVGELQQPVRAGQGRVRRRTPIRRGRRASAGARYQSGPGRIQLGKAYSWAKPEEGYGAVRAIDPVTGALRWEYKMSELTWAGVLTTASNVLFSGGGEGYFYALDARTGTLLWKTQLGSVIRSGPMTYSVNGKQYVTVAAGSALFSYKLRD